MNFSARNIPLSALAVLALSACQTNAPIVGDPSEISYGDPKAVEVVTTDLGSTDIQMTAEKMTQSLLQHPVVQSAIRKGELFVASSVLNKTSEYFDTSLITDTILDKLQKNGVRYVVEDANMQNQADELHRQNSSFYKRSTAARIGGMHGAKYRLDGSVSSITKKSSSLKDVYYKINLRLIDVETGIVEWSEEKEIRKTQNR